MPITGRKLTKAHKDKIRLKALARGVSAKYMKPIREQFRQTIIG